MTAAYFSFDLKDNAEKFVGAILDHGARPGDLSVIYREAGATMSGEDIAKAASTGISTTTAADFGKGAIAGTGIGFSLGIAAGLASLFIPGLGLVLGGGALASAIAGAAATTAGGALAGGIAGYLRDMGVGGEVPDELERDYASDYVIVAVARGPDGIDPLILEQMAEKYHATRNTLGARTAVAIPVEVEEVRLQGTDPVTGEAVETLDAYAPQGASAVATVPVTPVVPIPGTDRLVPTAGIEPGPSPEIPVSDSRLESAVVEPRAGGVETIVVREAAGEAKAIVTEVVPVVHTTSHEVVQAGEQMDLVEEAPVVEASRQPAEPLRGDARVVHSRIEEPPVHERIETIESDTGCGKRIESHTSLEQEGTERIEQVTVDPRTGTAVREVVERPVSRAAEDVEEDSITIEPANRS